MSDTPSIFVSYRRSDAAGHAGRLFDRFRHWFDPGVVFYDLAGIESGELFPQRLETALRDARVVLVLMGPDWLNELNRRAALPALDFVRVEVEQALSLRKGGGTPRIVPVLLGGARMPAVADLQETLRPTFEALLGLDAHEFHGKDADWEHQFARLRDLIAAVPGVPAPRFRAPARGARPIHLVAHMLSPHFNDPAGRLARLREQLTARGTATPTIVPAVLCGMGGVGKTQLALKYSLDNRDNYAGVWWLRAESENTLQVDAREACATVGVTLTEGESPMAGLKRWLADQEEPWLLVFDNAENADAVRPHLPQVGPHHVLVTSRDPAWGGVARSTELEVWSEDRGAGFLAARLSHTKRDDLEKLSRSLGGLPLALEQAAAFLEATGSSVEEYRAHIEGVDTAALVLDEGRASTGYEHSVFATMALSFPRLGSTARTLLGVCAYLGADPIPERCFREGLEPLPKEVLALGAKDLLAWNRTVGELRRYGIVTRVDIPALDRVPGKPDERTEKGLVFHRLTLEIARQALSDPPRHGRMAQRLMQAQVPASGSALEPKQWPRLAAVIPHVMSLDRFRTSAWLDPETQVAMIHVAGDYMIEAAGAYDEALRLFQSALELSKSALGEEHHDTLVCLSSVAEVYLAQEDYPRARALQEQGVAILKRTVGPEHTSTLASMSNLCLTMAAMGDKAGARETMEQVVRIRRRVHGDDHFETLTAMGNLALQIAQTEPARARQLFEQALSGFRRVSGEEHPHTLNAMHNLAEQLRDSNDADGARELHARALEGRRRVLGDEHPHTLVSIKHLAFAHGDAKDYAAARALLEELLSTRRRRLGDEHPDTLATLWNLAQMLAGQGDDAGARDLLERELSVERRVLGEKHVQTMRTKRSLGYTLWTLGESARAIELLAEVSEDYAKTLGPEHPDTRKVADILAFMRENSAKH